MKYDAGPVREPAGLIAVTNLNSKAMVSSQIYAEGMEEWAKNQGNHLYLIAAGPRVNAISVEKTRAGCSVKTEYFDGGWRPRTLRVPAGLFRAGELRVSDGVLIHCDGPAQKRHTAVEAARMILEDARRDRSPQARSWERHTINKFFRYSVVYVGQAYGRDTRISAIKRLADGHEHLQKVLACVNDYYRNSDVGVILMDAHIMGRELYGTVGPDNAEELGKLAAGMFGKPDGPLDDQGLLIDAAEAMLIRYLQRAENKKLKEFPLRDRPGLVEPLLGDGITHLGVQIDLSESFAVLQDPATQDVKQRQRYAVNLRTGEREIASNTPLGWQM